METMKKLKPALVLSKAYIVIAAAMWGTIGLFLDKMSGFGLDSMQVVFLRAAVAAAGLLVYVLIADRSSLKIRLCDIWIFAGTGVVSFVFFNYCYFSCIRLTSLPVAAALLYTAPVFVVLISAVLFREKITLQKLLAVLATVGGCLFLSGKFSQQEAISAAGILFGVASGFLYGLYSIFGQIGIRRGYRSMTISVYTFLFAAAASAFFVNIGDTFGAIASVRGVLWTVSLGIVSCIAPYLLYTKGLSHTEASAASVIATIEPVIAALIGFLYFRTEPTASKIIGIVLILSAVVLLNLRFGMQKKRSGNMIGKSEV